MVPYVGADADLMASGGVLPNSPALPDTAALVFATTHADPLANWQRDVGFWILSGSGRVLPPHSSVLEAAGGIGGKGAGQPGLRGGGGASACLSLSVSILGAPCRGRPKPGLLPESAFCRCWVPS